MAYVFLVAFVLIFVGELADKSQLLALLLATRYRVWQVLIGIFIATFVVHFFSTLLGQAVGSFAPDWSLRLGSGLLFIGFGIWTLRGDSVDDEEADRGAGRLGPILATAIAFFLAELGDKTQIMTLTIAADPGGSLLALAGGLSPGLRDWLGPLAEGVRAVGAAARFWGVTLGSTLGMVAADAIAIGFGVLLGKRLPERALRIGSGVAFLLVGVASAATVLVAR